MISGGWWTSIALVYAFLTRRLTARALALVGLWRYSPDTENAACALMRVASGVTVRPERSSDPCTNNSQHKHDENYGIDNRKTLAGLSIVALIIDARMLHSRKY